MIVYTPPQRVASLPVIELGAASGWSEAARDQAAREIDYCARNIGFFYVADHGVPAPLMADALALAREFFAEPLAAKRAIDIAHSPIMRGYEPIGLQTLDEGSLPDLKESLMLGRDLPADHPWVVAGLPYEGANQWPAQPTDFRPRANAYMAAIMDLGRRIAGLIARSLTLPDTYFAKALAEPSYTMRMLHYPPQAQIERNQIGCGAHTDWGFITMLLQDDVGGLEVRNAVGEWIVAPPVPGTFVVNLGDMVPLLTNGAYCSTPHRVLNSAGARARHSVASFFNPPPFYEVACVPSCRSPGAIPRPPISFSDHLHERFRTSYGGATPTG